MTITTENLNAVGLCLALTLVLTPVVRSLARHFGVVARPRSDRWHKRPTALMGGIAIFLPVTLVGLTMTAKGTQSYVIIFSSMFLFLVGLVDDFLNLKPYQKLIGQLLGAMPVIYCGLTLPWTGSPALDVAVTILWLVGITNAVNLLDNMDGLAAGVAMIAAGFLALNFGSNGRPAEAVSIAVLAAALLGFLVYNSHPASIFMGDCGSLFVGFFLAASAMLNPGQGRSRSFLPVLVVPVLILFLPIFDTTLVLMMRKLAGRSASQGGRDHTSHRLVALGLSERRAVWVLYAFSVVSGLLALAVRDMTLDVSLAAIAGFTIVLALLGVHVAGVKVYDEKNDKGSDDHPLVSFLVNLSYKRRVFEVLLDVLLIVLSYYAATMFTSGPIEGAVERDQFFRTVPVLVFVKVSVFLVMGVYRGLWRYVSLDSLVTYARAVLVSSALSVLILVLAFRFQGYSRAVFVLDGLILLLAVAGCRMAFRLLRSVLPHSPREGGRRVLIYGAGDAGELVLRELRNNRGLGLTPVGFVDDDPLKAGKVIHGLRVFAGKESFGAALDDAKAEQVLLSISKISESRLREVVGECEQAGVGLKRVRIMIESLVEPTDELARPSSISLTSSAVTV